MSELNAKYDVYEIREENLGDICKCLVDHSHTGGSISINITSLTNDEIHLHVEINGVSLNDMDSMKKGEFIVHNIYDTGGNPFTHVKDLTGLQNGSIAQTAKA